MRKLIKKIIKLRSSNNAVSEALGTVLLLGVSVAIFSALYIIVLSQTFETNETYPTIVSTIVGDNIIFEHRGGDSLGLDATVPLTVDGQKVLINEETPTVGDLLIDANDNDQWDIGEILSFNYYDEGYTINSEEADATATNEEKTDTIFMGSFDISPESDIGIQCLVDNPTPIVGEQVELTIVITHFRGNLAIPNLKINFPLPNGLTYFQSDTHGWGTYDETTGDWNLVNDLPVRQSATLTIIADVTSTGTISEFTQLALLIDGSGSIVPADWNMMRNGIAQAIIDGYIPHNGMVELTVIQFGGWTDSRSWAQVELGGPIVLDSTNYLDVADSVKTITQLGGGTAMDCAFRLAADVMSGDPYGYLVGTPFEGMASTHSDWKRQVVNLVTDGQPNINYIHSERYKGSWTYYENPSNEFALGKTYTEAALAYYESLMPINEAESDEIDAIAVGTATDIPWLRDHIVRPQPGYDNWPPTGPGWVKHVASYTEFADTIDEQFQLIFNGMTIEAELESNLPIDTQLLTYSGFECNMVHVIDNIYAVSYRDASNDGWIETISIDSAGNIGDSVNDKIEFDIADGYFPKMTMVDSDTIAIVYQGTDTDGFLITYNISSIGDITDTAADVWEFDAVNGGTPNIFHIDGSVFAIAYEGTDKDGFIKTLNIADTGMITKSWIDTLEFDTADAGYQYIFHISNNVYGVSYQGTDSNGFVCTMNIDNDGTISNVPIVSLEFDGADDVWYAPVIPFSDGYFLIVYETTGNDGMSCTIKINTDYYEWDTNTGRYMDAIRLGTSEYYLIAYQGANNDGYLCTIRVSNNDGSILGLIDSWEHDTSDGGYDSIVHVAGDVYAIAYRDAARITVFTVTVNDTNGAIANSPIDLIRDINDFSVTINPKES